MNNPGFNYNDLFLPAIKYGYDDFVALQRQVLREKGPIVQYANTFDPLNLSIIPAKNFNNNASQSAILEQKLLGEGFDFTSFKLDPLKLAPSFTVPLFCDKDNVPANYVFELFDMCRKAVYGDAIEHVVRVSSVSGTQVVFDSRSKFILQSLKNTLTQETTSLYLTVVNGRTLDTLTDRILVSNVSVNNATVTLASSISASATYMLGVFSFYNLPTYPAPADTPPNREYFEMSNEFFIASSRDGLYYPSLINTLNFNLSTELPSIDVNCVSKRIAKAERINLNNEEELPQRIPLFTAPRNEQTRIKISTASGDTLFYGITPVVQSGTNVAPNPLFDYKTGYHFGSDEEDLTTPQELLIQDISLSIDNKLKTIYSTHTPRYTFDENEFYINDLGRFDNSCAYGFYSEGRTIGGNIAIMVPEGDWFKKEFLPAISTNTEGSIEIDTGYMNFTLTKVVFDLAPDNLDVSAEYKKTSKLSFISTGYDSMFEIGLSKTGGRL